MDSDANLAPRPADRATSRRRAFLDAAKQIYLAQGFEAANVNDVVRLAGGSLTTLYAQFGSKEGLFLAVAEERLALLGQAMTPGSVDHMPLEQGLQAIGEKLVRALLTPESLAFFRLLVGEGGKFPQLLRGYAFTAADTIRDIVARYIKHAEPDIAEPEKMAAFFLELLRARHHYRALADSSYALSQEDLTVHVRDVVEFFLRGARRS